jgi:hypothetical protein
MAVPEKDNRIQLPPTLIDFDDQVGITGQDHDNFPAAGQQPRFDWMRIFCIGLLSCQSSNDPPTQYRIGTPWFNRVKNAYYIWSGTDWVSIASFISLMDITGSGGTTDTILSLSEWFTQVQDILSSIKPRVTYSGHASLNGIISIPVPSTVQDLIKDIFTLLRPIVHINGLLIDPRLTPFSAGCPTNIELLGGVKLNKNDTFTVIIERYDLFLSDEVIAS